MRVIFNEPQLQRYQHEQDLHRDGYSAGDMLGNSGGDCGDSRKSEVGLGRAGVHGRRVLERRDPGYESGGF